MQSAVTLKIAMNKMQERQSVLVSKIERIERSISQAEKQLEWDAVRALKRQILPLQDEKESLQESLNVYETTLKNFQVKISNSSVNQSSSKENLRSLVNQEESKNEHFNASCNVSDLLTKNIQIEALNTNTVKLLDEIENDIRVIQNSSKSLIGKISQCRTQLQESSRLSAILHRKVQFDLETDEELEELQKALDSI